MPSVFDPANIKSLQDSLIVNQIYDGLVAFDNMMIRPALAKTWEISPRGDQYIFTLRNATFHDGQPVRSEDVSYSLHRIARSNPPSPVWRFLADVQGAKDYRDGNATEITGIETPDEKTIVVNLVRPSKRLLFALAMNHAGIVSKKAVVADPSFQSPVGAGPFCFEKRMNAEVLLSANRDYYRSPPMLDQLSIVAYSGENLAKALNDFNNKRLHELPVYGDVETKITTPHTTISVPLFSLGFYGFNTQHGVFTNATLRRQLVACIDKASFVREIHGPDTVVAKGLLPEGVPGAIVTSVKGAGPDTKLDPPVEVTLLTTLTNRSLEREVAALNRAWKNAGVRVRTERVASWPSFIDRLKQGDFDLYRQAWTATMPDPAPFLEDLVQTNGRGNFMGYSNPQVDALLLEAFHESDPMRRSKLYQKVERLVAQDAPLLPIHYQRMSRAYLEEVSGRKLSPLGPAYVDYSTYSLQ